MSRLPHFPSHSNNHNGNVTVFTAPNVNNIHHYELVRLAQIRIAYLDPSLHLVSTLHSLGLFLCPDSSVRLCSPGASATINISYSILFNLTTSYSFYFGGKKGISRNKTSFFLLMR